jgi:hypothetical protein
MPPRNHTTEQAEPAAEPGTSPVPGKPLSQVEAESQPADPEQAAMWQAEYESRMAGVYPEPAAPAPAEETAEHHARSRAHAEAAD